MYILFKAYGKFSTDVYYGYKREGEDILESIAQTLRTSHLNSGAIRLENRAEYRLAEANGGIQNIMIEEIDIFDDEDEAWSARNTIRAEDADSITGPTPFPINLANRLEEVNPGTMKAWKQTRKLTLAKTAREAFKLGRWTKDQINTLSSTAKNRKEKRSMTSDFSTMKPDQFAEKYAL